MIDKADLPADPPLAGGEMETLVGFLDYQRGVVVRKVAEISEFDLRKPMTPTGLSLLGIVKHLTDVERAWFEIVFLGEDVALLSSGDDPDAGFRIEPGDTPDAIVAAYRDACARANRIVARADPAAMSARPSRGLGQSVSLRWILAHMIEETARHLGHLDLIREMFDRSTGD